MKKTFHNVIELRLKESKSAVVAILISIISLIISGVSLYITYWDRVSNASITLFKPTEYGIVRGMYYNPSDHLIVPLEWQNSGGHSAFIRLPQLILHNPRQTSPDLTLIIAGEIPKFSYGIVGNTSQQIILNSFVIEAHSVIEKDLVFHITNWWTDEGMKFKFKVKNCYQVTVIYSVNQEEQIRYHLFDLPIQDSVDKLNPPTLLWDHWPLEDKPCN
jgi:hypothetical protein